MKWINTCLGVIFLIQISDRTINVACMLTSIDEALLEDIFPPSSSRCTEAEEVAAGNSNNKFEFEFELTSSPSSNWNESTAKYENNVYHATLRHIDENKDRSWEIKVGKGGNIYSIIGPYGEAVAPQKHKGGPWIDEVWQSVSVDRKKNKNSGFFIHQAGTYMKDEEYMKDNPFYSPSIASFCDEKRRQCSFASWGQQAHIKTRFKSEVIYLNRYKDCGDGVIEFTSAVHHHAQLPEVEEGEEHNDEPSTPTLMDHLNVPWGGVRASTFPYILLSQPNLQPLKLILPLENFGSRKNIAFVKHLGGYILFAQKAPQGIAIPSFELPNTTQQFLVVDGNRTCHESSLHTDRCAKPCLRLKINHPQEIKSGACNPNLSFTNPRTNRHVTVTRVEHWAWKSNSLFFCPQLNSNNTTTSTPNEAAALEQLINEIFQKGDQILVNYDSSTLIEEDDTKKIYYGLALVFGKDDTTHFEQNMHDRWKYRPARIRYGATNRDYNVLSLIIDGQLHPGDTYVSRQYMISDSLDTIQSQSISWATETYQNFFTNIDSTATSTFGSIYLVSNTLTAYFGYTLDIHPQQSCPGSSNNLFNQLVCKGSSIPLSTTTLYPLFYIQCGTKTYIGFNKYIFSPPVSEDKIVRSYVCHGMDNHIRPIWKLLGYFQYNACDEILQERSTSLTFDPNFCDDDVVSSTITAADEL